MASAAVSCAICKAKFFAGSKACLWRLEMGNRVQLGGKSLPSPHDDAGMGGSLPRTAEDQRFAQSPIPAARKDAICETVRTGRYLFAGGCICFMGCYFLFDGSGILTNFEVNLLEFCHVHGQAGNVNRFGEVLFLGPK